MSTRYRLADLEALPTLSTGQADDLKIDTGAERVWLSRCSVADGEPFDHAVTVEHLDAGRWVTVARYAAA